jgi:hypothetical protein
MVKTLAQKVKQVERLEALEPLEVEAQKPRKKVIYFIIKVEYEPKPSNRKSLNKNKK